MKIKEYKLSKIANKTAIENNLILADGKRYPSIKRLFDFSLLDDIPISEIEKEIIKSDAIKNVSASNKIQLYGSIINQFDACDGKAKYNVHRVYKNCKLAYDIFELSKVEHYSKSRKSVYDNKYDVNTITANSGTDEPMNDIEL